MMTLVRMRGSLSRLSSSAAAGAAGALWGEGGRSVPVALPITCYKRGISTEILGYGYRILHVPDSVVKKPQVRERAVVSKGVRAKPSREVACQS